MCILQASKRLSRSQIIEASILTGILLGALSLLYVRLSFQTETPFFKELLNDGHLVIFAVISYAILKLCNLRRRSLWDWPWQSYLWSVGICVVLAGASELGQISTVRDADLRDLFFNLVGIFLTHGALFLWRNHQVLVQPPLTVRVLRTFFLILVLSVLLPSGLNLAGMAVCHYQSQHLTPHIAYFEEKWELFRWQENPQAAISLSSEFHSEGHRSLKVTCYPSAYPGVTLNDPPRDWTDYKFLSCEIFNSQDKIIKLFVRLDYGKPENRFYFTCSLQPGVNFVQLPLKSLYESPQKTSFDLAKVIQVIFFLFQPDEATCFYLDNVRLE